MGGTYQSKRIPVCGPPSVRRYQCFDRYRGIPIGTASDFDHYRGIPVYSEQDISKMPPELGNALSHERETVDDPEIRKQSLEALYLISLQVPYIVTYCLDFGPSGSVKTQISSG
ncbi:hypothetical protein GW17_00060740 [Ensete ventricosum]|nr:hypothetical protein GW17_00060740 [Ensete ventricosum]